MVRTTRLSARCFFDQTRVTRRLDIATPTPSPAFSRSRYRKNLRRIGNDARISRGQSSSPREPSLRQAFCSMVHDLQTKTPVHKFVRGYQRKVASAALFSFAQLGKNLSLFVNRSLGTQDRLKARLFARRAQPRAKKVFQFSNRIQRVSMRICVLRAPLHPVLFDTANENVLKQVESVGDRGLYIFLYLPGYGGGSEATGAFFFLNTYGGFLRWRIWATYSFFSIQHAFIDFECFCAFLCKV